MSARRIAYSTIAQILAKSLAVFVSSFMLVILANHLGTIGMGYYSTVTTFVTFFAACAELGVTAVMLREISQNAEARERITGEFFAFRIVFGAVMMSLGPLVALCIPQYSQVIVLGIVIQSVTQFIATCSLSFACMLQISLQLHRAVYAELASRIFCLVMIVFAAKYYTDSTQFFFFVLWLTALAGLMHAVVTYLFARQLWRIRPCFGLRRLKAILILVLPMGLFSVLGMVHFKSDTFLLSVLRPAYDVGIYGYAYRLAEILFHIPLMFVGTTFPRMSELRKTDLSGFSVFCQKVFATLGFVALPVVTGVALLAPYLTTLLAGQNVADAIIAGHVLRILSIAMLGWFFSSFFQYMLLAGSDYSVLTRNLALAAVANIVLNVLLIPYFSYYAAALITVATEAGLLLLTALAVHDRTGFRPQLRPMFPVVWAAALMSGAVAWAGHTCVIPVADFAVAPRLYQLLVLCGLSLFGAATYAVTLWFWPRESPLRAYLELLRGKSMAAKPIGQA